MSESTEIKPEELTLRDLIVRLTAKQLWGLICAFATLLIATFTLGFSAATYKSNIDLDRAKIEHGRELAEAKRNLSEVTEAKTQAKSMAQAAASERAAIVLKITFLDHFLRYSLAKEQGGDDFERAKSLFVGFVHRVWKAQEDQTVNVVMDTRDRTERELVRVDRPVVTPPSIQKPASTYRWQERRVQETVIKTIKFFDGSTYVIPYEVAGAVHKQG